MQVNKFKKIYKLLYKKFGPQHWWPAKTPFEVIIGAILTQNTAWSNVEKAIVNLKKNKLLDVVKLKVIKHENLALLIKPAGYFNVKARRIKNFINFLFLNYSGDLDKLFSLPKGKLKEQLLSVNGIGPETADSIILYAANKPVFVVDNYTKRIFLRHKLLSGRDNYHDIQKMFMKNISRDTTLYNEYHALIVKLGKDYCKRKPKCEACPLKRLKKAG